ncbi:MAG: ATP-binding cassette domain-containing protein [Clostridiales bacterium]|nr:ATP-binding cassette domain-containing protein [Eubacterium sp.]MDD7350209.1 ATP-binding cassette domain-containing protein [Clostridiales bacterium]MDY3774186.1 ATP-binding cassette domain-containing protein [Eubacterium sp.]
MQLELEHISKRFKDKLALEDVCVKMKPGVNGLLGPNGAGKSTLMGILTKNLMATSGIVRVDGKDISHMKTEYISQLGFAPQQQNMYPSFTGFRFMYYMAALKGISKKKAKMQIEILLKKVNLWEDAGRKIGHYSGGMKQRLLVAQAMLGNPQIILLDEPSAGLDPKERVHLRGLMEEMAEGRIVIVATHIISDIESIADDIFFLKEGKLKEVSWEKGNTLEQMYLEEFGNE